MMNCISFGLRMRLKAVRGSGKVDSGSSVNVSIIFFLSWHCADMTVY